MAVARIHVTHCRKFFGCHGRQYLEESGDTPEPPVIMSRSERLHSGHLHPMFDEPEYLFWFPPGRRLRKVRRSRPHAARPCGSLDPRTSDGLADKGFPADPQSVRVQSSWISDLAENGPTRSLIPIRQPCFEVLTDKPAHSVGRILRRSGNARASMHGCRIQHHTHGKQQRRPAALSGSVLHSTPYGELRPIQWQHRYPHSQG